MRHLQHGNRAATNGSVDAYVAGTANVVLDISSYFAP